MARTKQTARVTPNPNATAAIGGQMDGNVSHAAEEERLRKEAEEERCRKEAEEENLIFANLQNLNDNLETSRPREFASRTPLPHVPASATHAATQPVGPSGGQASRDAKGKGPAPIPIKEAARKRTKPTLEFIRKHIKRPIDVPTSSKEDSDEEDPLASQWAAMQEAERMGEKAGSISRKRTREELEKIARKKAAEAMEARQQAEREMKMKEQQHRPSQEQQAPRWEREPRPPPPPKPKRKYKYRPGTVALREIRKYQKSTEPVIPKAPFTRVVREIMDQVSGVDRISAGALAALQDATEDMAVGLFQDSVLCMAHAKRVTIKPIDMALAIRIRSELCLWK